MPFAHSRSQFVCGVGEIAEGASNYVNALSTMVSW